MTTSTPSPRSEATTILVFGDATESWIEDLDQLYKQASSTPWLKSFLDKLSDTINAELKTFTSQADSPGHFSSLQELGQRYFRGCDDLGMVDAILLHTVRAGYLLQWVHREPQLIGRNAQTEWIGISGGLANLSPLAVAEDFQTLHDALLEASRIVVRGAKITSERTRAVEDRSGSWGWAVLGITADNLRMALDDFQRKIGVRPSKRVKVGVVGAGWSTVLGPPSVMELVMNQCPALKNVAKHPLAIKALQHTLDISPNEVDYILGADSAILDRPIACPNHHLWGMDKPSTYANWGSLMRDLTVEVLGHPLDIPQVMRQLNSALNEVKNVRIVSIGSCSHVPYMATALKEAGKEVSVRDQHSLLDTKDSDPSLAGRIAIVGMAGRGPKSDNVDEFWNVIMSKQDCHSEVPKDRFDIDEYYCEKHERGDSRCKMSTKFGCFMDNPGHFDNRFFQISPREALLMDPCHRQFLMASYEALEMAGYSDGRTKASDPNRTASFFAQATEDWHRHTHPVLGCDSYTLQANQRAFGAGRIAWHFNLEGPTYALDSACAGTTACIHLACMSLLTKDVDMAVVGAGNILSWPHSFTCLSDSGILSDTGNSKPFRDDADGYCRGDFVGSVVLKRLEDAVKHNDNILGVVAGSGRNHSGNSTSITTSDAGAQERLFRKVMRNAQVSPNDVSYAELHQTGTQTGDPAEMGAIASIFKDRPKALGPLPVGGVKANIGHSEAAAGIAELLKCLMMFKKDIIPPQAQLPAPLNHNFPPLTEINVEIPTEPRPFKKHTEANKPRRVLLNNFDAAGGNACLLLEDYNAKSAKTTAVDPRAAHVITTSARTKQSLAANKAKFLEWLRANPETRLQDIAYTTTARRMHHPLRLACTASSVPELIKKLEGPDSAPTSSSNQDVVFVFTGQGSHYSGMGAELYRTNPVFRETVDLCVGICEGEKFPPFADLITNGEVDLSKKNAAQTQLAVLTLEIALAAVWRSAGIEPKMVMGHSLGEYAALHVAGVLSLADTLHLVGSRALMLLERCESGSCAMLAVSTSLAAVKDLLKQRPSSSCSVACINAPNATVVSGTAEDLAKFQADLMVKDSKARATKLSVPFAFHSFQMDPILQDYTSLASGVAYSAPKIPVASTLLGTVVDKAGVFNEEYLISQTRQQVDFVGGLQAVKSKLSDPIWLEVGPGPVCTSFVRATLETSPSKVLHTLDSKTNNWTSLSRTMSAAYMHGINIDWLGFHRPYESKLTLLTLPAYSWTMKDYWVTFTDKTAAPVAEKASPEPFYTTCAQYLVSKTASPKVQVTFRATVGDHGFLDLIDGHKMQQVGLASGSVFCDAALAVAKYALEYSGRKGITGPHLTVHNPELLAPLTRDFIGLDGELLTTASMDSASSNEILCTFQGKSAAGVTHDMGSITIRVNDPQVTQTTWNQNSYFIKTRMDEFIKNIKEGAGHRMQPEILYTLFADAVEFGPHFKGIQEGFIAKDFQEAAAKIVLLDDPVGTRFGFSPYWSEALAHLAGFMVQGNPAKSPRTTFIVMGFDTVQQTADFEAGKEYMVYTRINRWEENTAFCDAFIFDPVHERLIMQCRDLRYMELPRAAWRRILDGGDVGHSTAITPSSQTQKHVPKAAETNEVVAKVEEHQIEAPLVVETLAPASPGVFEDILAVMIKATGADPSEITDETVVADIGIDSIMAIEIVAAVKTKVGIDLPARFVFEYPKVGDLRREYGGQHASPEAPQMEPKLKASENLPLEPETSGSVSRSSSIAPSAHESSADSVGTPNSMSDNEQDYVKIEKPLVVREAATVAEVPKVEPVDDGSPLPSVRITLLRGRPGAGKTPLYLMADGTGSIATYIHLPPSKAKIPIYGIDSPFLRCPSRLTPEVGIEGVAKLVVEALVKARPEGPFMIGGFSAGSYVAYEVARQLGQAGRKVDGLLLVDLCAPRPAGSVQLDSAAMNHETDIGVTVFGLAAAEDGRWNINETVKEHLRQYMIAMRRYHPPPMAADERPARSAVIWAERGLINRIDGNSKSMELLKEAGIPTKAYPGFMEDPKLGPFACFVPDKTQADLGPNGWDKYTGDILPLSVDSDHLNLPMPGTVHLLQTQMEAAYTHFAS